MHKMGVLFWGIPEGVFFRRGGGWCVGKICWGEYSYMNLHVFLVWVGLKLHSKISSIDMNRIIYLSFK